MATTEIEFFNEIFFSHEKKMKLQAKSESGNWLYGIKICQYMKKLMMFSSLFT